MGLVGQQKRYLKLAEDLRELQTSPAKVVEELDGLLVELETLNQVFPDANSIGCYPDLVLRESYLGGRQDLTPANLAGVLESLAKLTQHKIDAVAGDAEISQTPVDGMDGLLKKRLEVSCFGGEELGPGEIFARTHKAISLGKEVLEDDDQDMESLLSSRNLAVQASQALNSLGVRLELITGLRLWRLRLALARDGYHPLVAAELVNEMVEKGYADRRELLGISKHVHAAAQLLKVLRDYHHKLQRLLMDLHGKAGPVDAGVLRELAVACSKREMAAADAVEDDPAQVVALMLCNDCGVYIAEDLRRLDLDLLSWQDVATLTSEGLENRLTSQDMHAILSEGDPLSSSTDQKALARERFCQLIQGKFGSKSAVRELLDGESE